MTLGQRDPSECLFSTSVSSIDVETVKTKTMIACGAGVSGERNASRPAIVALVLRTTKRNRFIGLGVGVVRTTGVVCGGTS